MDGARFFGALDTVVSTHRAFGDSAYIIRQANDVFARRLGEIAEQAPAAQRLRRALENADHRLRHAVLGDTVVRCAIQQVRLLRQEPAAPGLPLERCGAVLDSTAEQVVRTGHWDPVPIAAFPSDGGDSRCRVWTGADADSIHAQTFHELVTNNYGAAPCPPTARELEALRSGRELLRKLAPSMAASALSHTRVVAVFPNAGQWKGSASSSQFRLAGTIFLSRGVLGYPEATAEHLLHESLHQKLYDFRHGHLLFEPRQPGVPPAVVCSPWNAFDPQRSNHWDSFRAFAAFHVYVHLALLGACAEQHTGDGPRTISSRTAVERARYLGERLVADCWSELGPAGRRFHQWLTAVLDAIDPDARSAGATIHLLLDLYQREARRSRLNGVNGEALHTMARAELTDARTLLGDLDGAPDGDDPVELFVGVRAAVSRAIQTAYRGGYRVPGRGEDVELMLQRCSEHLNSLLQAELT